MDDKNISAIAWESKQEKLIAIATFDKKVTIWDVETEKIKFNVQTAFPALYLSFSMTDPNQLIMILDNDEVKLLDLAQRQIEKMQLPSSSKPNSAKFHPKRDGIVAVGYQTGQIVFVDVKTLNTWQVEKTIDAAVSDLEWDPNESHLLVAYSNGVSIMIDFDFGNSQVRQVFEQQTQGIGQIVWKRDRSGDFLTSSPKVGALRLWNVAQPSSKGIIKVGNSPVNALTYIPNSDLVLISFKNGQVIVFDIETKKTEFQTEAGHAETIFDLASCPSDKNVFASCSYDGTVRVWDAASLKLLSICDSKKNTPIKDTDKHIIYSVSYAPTDQRLALVGNKGYIMVFNGARGKLLCALKPHEGSSFKVDWNQKDPSLIIMGSQEYQAILLTIDQNNQVVVKQAYKHPHQVFGVHFHPINGTQFLTGCLDTNVRLFEVGNLNPIKVFSGHSSRVFNVVFSPTQANLFVSGSDDRSIRVWNTQEDVSKELVGHTNKVRAISFNHELTWLLLSGSWDATIRVWDIRNRSCLHVITDHQADVYGIISHPLRPFVFISSSRDTTIRVWQIDSFMTPIKMKIFLGQGKQVLSVSDDDKQASLRSEYAKKLITQSEEVDFRQFKQLFSYLNLIEGQDEVLQELDVIINKDYSPQKDQLQIVHASCLGQHYRQEAMKLHKAGGMQYYGTPYAKKEDRLLEAANLYLKSGQLKEYCDVMVLLGDFEKALCFAPSVSIEFWQKIAEMQAEKEAGNVSEEAVETCLMANQIQSAIQICKEREEYEDAKLLKALEITGTFQSVLDCYRSTQQSEGQAEQLSSLIEQMRGLNLAEKDPQIYQIVQEEAEKLFYQGQPLMAAASFLSINSFKDAIQICVRCNELYLAYFISKNLYPLALREVSELLGDRSEKYFLKDVCEKIYKESEDKSILSTFQARMVAVGLIKKDAQLKALQQQRNQQADSSLQGGNYLEAVEYFILAGCHEQACKVGTQRIASNLESNQSLYEVFLITDLLQSQSLNFQNQELQALTQIMCAYSGIYKAIYLGYGEILMALLTFIIDLHATCPQASQIIPTSLLSNIETTISDNLLSRANHKDQYRVPLTSISLKTSNDSYKQHYLLMVEALKEIMAKKSALFPTPGIYLNMVIGSNLQGGKQSLFTKLPIRGSAFVLEDGKSALSQEEAIEWCMCMRFSPLKNGYRMSAF